MSDLPNASGAVAGPVLVSSQSELNAALAAATGGETILLAGGSYSGLTLVKRSFGETVTIASADDDNPAVFTGPINLVNVSGLTIEGVDVLGEAPLESGFARISIRGGSDITLSDMHVSGSIRPFVEGVEDELAGYPTEFGVVIDGARGVRLEGLEMTQFAKAVRFANSEDITVSGSEFHQIRSDGIAMSSSRGILIEDNYFHDFHPLMKNGGTGDHPDYIQYFGDRAAIGVHDVIIRDNAFIQGDGYAVQAIFGWSGGATPSPFTNFVVSGNFIQNSQIRGVALGDVIGAQIIGNVMIPNGDTSGAFGAQRPSIYISTGATTDAMRDILIDDNVMTMSWNPVFNPSGLDAAGNEARGIVYGDLHVLDQGRLVPDYWSEITLPDRNDFPDHASFMAAAMETLRVSLPESVAALLPLPAVEETSGVAHLVGEGWTRLDGVDFASGDVILIEGEEAITSLDALLLRAAASGAEGAEGADLRLVEATATGLRVVDIDLAGMETVDGFSFLPAPRVVTVAYGDSVSLAFAADGISGAAVSHSGGSTLIDGATLIYSAGAGEGHRLDQINFAVADGQGSLGFGSVFVAIRDAAAAVSTLGDEGGSLLGGGGAEALIGGGGRDVLFARAGDDWLEGGAGNDRLTGGAGSDFLIGGDGADQFVFYGADLTGGSRDVIVDLDFAEGDRITFAHFGEGTFGEGYAFGPANGSGAAVLTMAQFLTLGGEDGFALERLGEGHALLTAGDEAEVEIIFEGASVKAFEEAWPLA